ncbi:hypothetical protein ACTFIR_011770 [Dictyostelium discoideum]
MIYKNQNFTVHSRNILVNKQLEIGATENNENVDMEQLCNTLQGRLSDKEIDQILKDSPGLTNKLKRINEIVSEFKEKKNLVSIIEDNVAYGCWIDPILEAKEMIVKHIEFLHANNILYESYTISFCSCIEIVSGALSLAQMKSPFNNRPIFVLHGKGTYHEFRKKLKIIFDCFNKWYEDGYLNVDGERLRTHLFMVNDYACNVVLAGVNVNLPVIKGDQDPTYGCKYEPLVKFKEWDIIPDFLHVSIDEMECQYDKFEEKIEYNTFMEDSNDKYEEMEEFLLSLFDKNQDDHEMFFQNSEKLLSEMKKDDEVANGGRLYIKQFDNNIISIKKKVGKLITNENEYENCRKKVEELKVDYKNTVEILIEKKLNKNVGKDDEKKKEKFIDVVKRMGITIFKSNSCKSVCDVIDTFSFTFTDCVKLLNGRDKILKVLCDEDVIDDYIQLWNMYSFFLSSLQTNKYQITKEKWLEVGSEFTENYLKLFDGVQWTSYFHCLCTHTGEWIEKIQDVPFCAWANFGIESRHKHIKMAIKESNHKFDQLSTYENTLVKCYNNKNGEIKEHGWCKSTFDPPPELFFGGKKVDFIFERKVEQNEIKEMNEPIIIDKIVEVKEKPLVKEIKKKTRGPYKKKNKVKQNSLQNLSTKSIFEKTVERLNINKNYYTLNVNGDIFEITNEKNIKYLITINHLKQLVCTCPAHTIHNTYHGKYCKHIIYVLINYYNMHGDDLKRCWDRKCIPNMGEENEKDTSENKNIIIDLAKNKIKKIKEPNEAIKRKNNDFKMHVDILTTPNARMSNFLINDYCSYVLNGAAQIIMLSCVDSNMKTLNINQQTKTNIQSNDVKSIVVPFLIKYTEESKNHWIMYILKKKEKNKYDLEEYDSLYSKETMNYKGSFTIIINDELGWNECTYKKKNNFITQDNSYDCGFYLCMFLKYFTKNIPINKSRVNPASVSSFKKEMLNDLIL